MEAAHFVILSGEKRRMLKMAYLKHVDWVEGSRETLIQSQNQISYGFLYIASSSSSLHTKRRGVLIALRAVVISSVAERSFLHCGQYHIGTAEKRRLGATHILCLSVCKEDFSLALEMTVREGSRSPAASIAQGQPFFKKCLTKVPWMDILCLLYTSDAADDIGTV